MNPTEYQRTINDLFASTAISWEQVYAKDTVFARIHQQRQDLILAAADALELPPRSPVLDVGCGAGLITAALAERGHCITAIDPVPEMIAMTARRAAARGVSTRVVPIRTEVSGLPFRDETFALVIAAGVLPWLPAIEDPLREMRRVLRPGGQMIVSVDNAWRLHLLLDVCARCRTLAGDLLRWLGLRRTGARARMHSVRTLDHAVSAAGFSKCWGKTFGFGPFTFCGWKVVSDERGLSLNDSLQRLADRGAPLLGLTGAQYVVLARKPAPACNASPQAHQEPRLWKAVA